MAQKTTGVARSVKGSFLYVRNGRFVETFTGLAKSLTTGDIVYVTNGRYDSKFNGKARFEGKEYTVKNGRVVK